MWLSGLEDVDRVSAVIAGLIARGYKETDVDKILGGNLLRLVEQVIG